MRPAAPPSGAAERQNGWLPSGFSVQSHTPPLPVSGMCMQSIQALAREILNSQKNLAERTRKQAQQGTSGSGDARDEEDPPR